MPGPKAAKPGSQGTDGSRNFSEATGEPRPETSRAPTSSKRTQNRLASTKPALDKRADTTNRAPAGLYIVATPIGNAADITLRALDILARVDVIACEDTRVSAKLLQRHGIGAPLLAYHEHNAERMRPVLLGRIVEGQAVALISDAGTPLVSDPGFKLVRQAIADGLAIQMLPGASAPIAALVLSGLPSDRFLFAGFLDARTAARRRELAELAAIRATLIFFESAQRLAASLADMAAELGDRPAAVARELTKLYEEVRHGSLAELARHYGAVGPPKGEIVVVVGPPLPAAAPDAADLDARLEAALARLSVRDAASEVAEALGLKRREVYARALELAGATGKGGKP
jgi:16S rRNA (cytidine1402-2'-O)-methyltransferase